MTATPKPVDGVNGLHAARDRVLALCNTIELQHGGVPSAFVVAIRDAYGLPNPGGYQPMTGSQTFEEWRVVGDPNYPFPRYDFTFGSPTRRAAGYDEDPEAAARAFVALARDSGRWVQGPHLSMRRVTYTDWETRDA